MPNELARVEQTIYENIHAFVKGVVHIETIMRPTSVTEMYWERVYIVAWERADQCGTHRVNINSDGEAACFMGHYDLSREGAIADMIERSRKAIH
jgi:hypothetical protein